MSSNEPVRAFILYLYGYAVPLTLHKVRSTTILIYFFGARTILICSAKRMNFPLAQLIRMYCLLSFSYIHVCMYAYLRCPMFSGKVWEEREGNGLIGTKLPCALSILSFFFPSQNPFFQTY